MLIHRLDELYMELPVKKLVFQLKHFFFSSTLRQKESGHFFEYLRLTFFSTRNFF